MAVRKSAIGLCGLVGIGVFAAGILAGGAVYSTTTVRTVTVTQTKAVYSGIERVPVPGPVKTVTRTKYVAATEGPTGTEIASYSGTGNQATGKFNVPKSGDYVIRWSYSGNDTDGSPGGDNFSITPVNNNGSTGNYPDDIATSGSGSTEDTGMSGGQVFDVQASGSWTITVISAD